MQIGQRTRGLVAVILACGMANAVCGETSTLAGGGPAKTDCIVELRGSGTAFPAGRRARGLACDGGEPCKAAGSTQRTPCRFSLSLCINVPGVTRCSATDVARLIVRSRSGLDLSGLTAAVAALGLPSGEPRCTAPVDIVLPVAGPDADGALRAGKGKLVVRATTSRGRVDKDIYALVCNPGSGPLLTEGGGQTSPTTTTAPGTSTTTTLTPDDPGVPGAGLVSEILGASVSPAGVVAVRFSVTDEAGVPLQPRTAGTSDGTEARVRFTIARLDVNVQTVEGFATDFTRYVNYVTARQTSPITHVSSDLPTYDSGGMITTEDAGTGVYVYTFATRLPAGFPANRTHTIAGQVERSVEGSTLAANPVFDFVPDGTSVTTVRAGSTTAQCNQCHNPLQAHGGGRRAVRLCQVCHTDQAVDPDTGNAIDWTVMVHRIHRGKDLPSIGAGPVGTTYSIIGYRQSEAVFARRVKFCRGGRHAMAACGADADCPGGICVDTVSTCSGGARGGLTCTGDTDCPGATCAASVKTVGVAFPRDLRGCEACHAEGATAANHRERASAAACTGCHDDVNPSETTTAAGPPGTNHVAGAQPDALCRVCHKASGVEFDVSVPGAHTIPGRSTALAGLRGEILSATGAPDASPRVRFRITDGGGTPLASLAGLGRVAFALSGPGTGSGGAAMAVLTPIAVGSGASGTLEGPDAEGVHTYTLSATNKLPLDASGTWRVGLEARRSVAVGAASFEEALQNPVLDFAVDGTPVAAWRTVVDDAKCAACHATFSVDTSVHGNLRNRVEYCVVCHNPAVSDFSRRARTFCAVTCGANKRVDSTSAGDDVQLLALGASCAQADTCAMAVGPDGIADTAAAGDDVQRVDAGTGAGRAATEPIDLKPLLHRIHMGEHLEQKPLLVYGFGTSPRGFGVNDFGDVLFPGALADCERCHVGGTQLLPLPAGVLPTRTSVVALNPDATKWGSTPFVEAPTGSIPPIQDACGSCHDGAAVAAHATTNTTAEGVEACAVCHGEGRGHAVSAVHGGS